MNSVNWKKVKFIYNPKSGNKTITNKLDKIIKKYQKNNLTIVPYRIYSECNLDDSLSDIDESYDHILIAGGDGTINRVINAVKKNKIDIPIAILPVGTANDFAKMLDMPLNINKALDRIIHSEAQKIDLGKVNDSYFVNIASSGIFTDVSQKIDPLFKSSLGRASYILKGMEEVANLKKRKISLKSKEFNYDGDMYLVIILNGSTAGNISLSKSSSVCDGLLDVIIFKQVPLVKTLPIIRRLIMGLPIDSMNEIEYFKTSELTIECDENISTDIDGESGPSYPLNIKCEHLSLSIKGID